MRVGMGWRSLNPVEAASAVHEIQNRRQLLQIAYEAGNPEARRLAVLKLNDQRLFSAFAQSDPSEIVRRRLVRELKDPEEVEHILEKEKDASVIQAAKERLKVLREGKNE
ncbi:MAG: hypothetical protein IKE16_06015 [Solobacterium sp.]|nr:hypothetical protein [Solobacterium sp.]MBR2770352.1 hypothetical protein [Solobacterium sp.]MBR2794187.1 hypothetical protein [Solobacterium sp.]